MRDRNYSTISHEKLEDWINTHNEEINFEDWTMQKIQKKDDRTSSVYKLTKAYANFVSGYYIRAFEIHQSTSADGWKYHKRNKRKKP